MDKTALITYVTDFISPYFFDKETIAFFSSELETGLLKDQYFITSEQDTSYKYPAFEGERRYSIRCIDHDNKWINTVNNFMEYETLEQAKKALKELVKWTINIRT